MRRNRWILAIFATGTALAIGCCAFTYWLSTQKFACPRWALDCSVSDFVRRIAGSLNQVQGIVGAVFTVSIAMMAHATYQLAETTLWPALTSTAFSLCDIDNYVALTRGSLTASPMALSRARGVGQVTVLLAVTLIGMLRFADSVIVGYAYSLTNVTTTFKSNYTSGGGLGLTFDGFQSNPPGMLPGAAGAAASIYTSWASGLSSEPLPDLRQFVIDRANLSAVGNFSAFAVEAYTDITCSPWPIEIARETKDKLYVEANMSQDALEVRQQPMLTLWVDRWRNVSAARAVTTIMFAAINGTIEGGFKNGPTDAMRELGYTNGVSSVACDVDVGLRDGTVCTHSDPASCPPPKMILSELETIGPPQCDGKDKNMYCISVWLAAAVNTYGVSIYGTQPMFSPPFRSGDIRQPRQLLNTTTPLPLAWTSTASSGTSYDWTQETLKNFVQVGSGALAMTITRHFLKDSGDLESTLVMSRLKTSRSLLMFLSPGLVMASLVVVAVMSKVMYKATNVPDVRSGATSEIILGSQSNDIRKYVGMVRASAMSRGAFSRLRVRYGIVAEGTEGLAHTKHVAAFPKREK